MINKASLRVYEKFTSLRVYEKFKAVTQKLKKPELKSFKTLKVS